MKPGLLGLGPGAGVTLAVSVDSSPPGSGCPWPPGAGPAARVLRSARRQPSSSAAVGTSAPQPAPPPRSPPPPCHTGLPRPARAGQRPPPPRPDQGSCCSRSRSPRPSPSPRQPGLSPQINGLPDTPAPPVQCPASQSQTDTQRWRDRLVTGKARNTHARRYIQTTHRPHHDRHTLQAPAAGQTPRLQVEREAEAGGGEG